MIPPTVEEFMEPLGLLDIEAFGASSKKLPAGNYRNKIYTYIPEGPKGLMALCGSPEDNRAFDIAKLAPANASVAFQMSFSFSMLRDTAIAAATALFGTDGEGIVRQLLARPIPQIEKELTIGSLR